MVALFSRPITHTVYQPKVEVKIEDVVEVESEDVVKVEGEDVVEDNKKHNQTYAFQMYVPKSSLKTTHPKELSAQHHQSYYFVVSSNDKRLPEKQVLDYAWTGALKFGKEPVTTRAVLYACSPSRQLNDALGLSNAKISQQWIGSAVIIKEHQKDAASMDNLWDAVKNKLEPLLT